MSENQIKIIAKTDVGKVREHNEDNYIVCPDVNKKEWFFSDEIIEPIEGTLFVIADGMGGLNAGEIASAITIDTIKKYFNNPERKIIDSHEQVKIALIESINNAQTNILNHAKANPETKGMGTTVVIAFIKDNVLHTAWVGDSRCYVFRNDSELYFATNDHSYVQELVDSGQINMQQAFYHPESNIITRSLGDNSNKVPKPDFCSFPLMKGDKVLLCSDGLNGMLQDETIASLMHQSKDIVDLSKQLIDAANEAGGHDNITLILSEIVQLNEKNKLPDDIKLRELKFAAHYIPESDSQNPFKTLSPEREPNIEEEPISDPNFVDSEKNTFFKRVAIITSILVIILSICFFIFNNKRKKGDISNHKTNADTLNRTPVIGDTITTHDKKEENNKTQPFSKINNHSENISKKNIKDTSKVISHLTLISNEEQKKDSSKKPAAAAKKDNKTRKTDRLTIIE